MNIKQLISQYGTYLSIAAAVATAGYQAYTGNMIPDWVYTLEGAAGLTAFRTTVSVAGAGNGWKGYATAVIAAGIAGLQAYGIMVPDMIVDPLLAAAGLYSIHSAVQKI